MSAVFVLFSAAFRDIGLLLSPVTEVIKCRMFAVCLAESKHCDTKVSIPVWSNLLHCNRLNKSN